MKQAFWISLFVLLALIVADWWRENVRVKTAWTNQIQGVWVSTSMSGAHVGFVGHFDQGTAWIQVWPNLSKPPDCIGIYEGLPFVQYDGKMYP